jgi:hypothetical protein
MSVPCTEPYVPNCIFLSMWSGFQMRHLLLEHHEGVAEGISVPTHGRPAGCKRWVHVSVCICMYLYVFCLYNIICVNIILYWYVSVNKWWWWLGNYHDSQQGIGAPFPEACPVTRMPAFPVGGATFWGCLVGQPAVLHQLVGYDNMADWLPCCGGLKQ